MTVVHYLARGQVWLCRRGQAAKRKRAPCSAELLESIDPRSIRPPFDFKPLLQTVYHWLDALPPSTPNPLPARIILAASEGKPPPGVEGHEDTREELEAARIDLLERGGLKALATAWALDRDNGNGKKQ